MIALLSKMGRRKPLVQGENAKRWPQCLLGGRGAEAQLIAKARICVTLSSFCAPFTK
jgi:hypothetical protein